MSPSHLALLQSAAAKYPDDPVFKLPVLDTNGQLSDWYDITYTQFLRDVELYARHWSRLLLADNVPPSSVVGIW